MAGGTIAADVVKTISGGAKALTHEALPATERQVIATAAQTAGWKLVPSELDALGPFYSHNIPLGKDVRSDVTAEGHELLGTILDARTGAPIKDAKLELWSVLPDEHYRFDFDRGAQVTGADGQYAFRSDYPIPYFGRPSHVHLYADAPGYHGLVTQQYPTPGEASKTFDVVLEPVLPGQTRQLKVLQGNDWRPDMAERASGWVGQWNGPE